MSLRRVRRVLIKQEIFIELMKHGCDAVMVMENPLPEDTCYLSAGVEERSGIVQLLVESATFDEVPSDAQIPLHPRVVFSKRP